MQLDVRVIVGGWLLLATPFSFSQDIGKPETVPPAVSPSGYGGVGFTPSANPTPQGMAVLGFSSAIPGKTSESGFNFMGSFGLMPGLEVTGRLMTRDLQCNLYRSDCGRPPGIRDLSAGLKLSTVLASSARSSFLGAVGVTDFGGAATLSRSVFAVGTWNTSRWSVSAGYLDPVSPSAFGEGPFASVAWAASESIQLNAEAVDRDVMGSVRLWVPRRWLPENTAVYVDAHHHLRQVREVLPRTSFGVGVAIDLDPLTASRPSPPLSGVAEAVRGFKDWVPLWASPTGISALWSGTESSAEDEPREDNPRQLGVLTTDAADQHWAVRAVSALERAGFEDVRVGRSVDSDRWIIRFENIDYQHNDLDALAVAAGHIAAIDEPAERRVVLRLMRRGVESIDFDFWLQCLKPFLEQDRPCLPGEVSLRSADRGGESVDWRAIGRQRSWLVPRVYVVPAVESRVGTEYGAWDASFAANVAVHVPLWRGALIEGAQIFPLNNTRDFEADGVFSRYRFSQKTNHRVMLHQAIGLPNGLAGRVAVGRVGDLLEGYAGEIRWEPASGRHKLGVEASKFKILDEGLSGDGYLRSQIVSYRYFSEPLQATFEIKAGEFFNGDEGFLVFSRFWFGDVSITPYYRKTERKLGFYPQRPFGRQIVPALPERAFAGLEFSFPLSPRKGLSGRWLRVNANDRFFYAIETVVNNPSNNLLREYGQFAPVPLSLDGTVFNFDRASDAYLRTNLRRIPMIWRKIDDRGSL
jgi:hypothetical protein